jgi:LytS/YehU family sensor histidine kinase
LHDKKELSTKTITRLSEFIRYSLYEAGAEKVPLESEARLLENYVELERIRLNCTSVTFEYKSDNGSYRLPPLLFLPVAENAFKYTADEAGNHIFLQMRASGGLLEFSARNSSTEIHDSKEGGGIGLLNFSKRLKLYYGEKAKYNVVRENGSYFVHVSIELT